ncbi:MAG: hypothetical protein M3Z37_07485 [Candidatus Eremiobacteraeota bacterium]|nr:hypothetical protein [Candidatus Eremiobacteraeota bacterium]
MLSISTICSQWKAEHALSFARFLLGPTLMRLGFFFCILACGHASAAAASNGALDFAGLHWRSIGPAVAGGRVAAVAGSDADPFLYYMGAAGGGVYRTRDGGATWVDVFSKQPSASIGAIALAPSDRRIVWVGTGESKPRNDITLGDGVWQSRDGGDTWVRRGLDGTALISRVLIHPANPDVVLVAALGDPYKDSGERGVYRTSDGGKSWQHTLSVGPASGASDLAWDRTRAKLVFAGIWQLRRLPWTFTSGGDRDGLYRSKDGGVTWQRLTGHGLPNGRMGRIGVAIAPGDPRRVYALIQSQAGALWRSDDSGDHWRQMSADTLINQRPFYMSRVEVDPRDPNHVFFLSEDLVESKDGGHTFHDLRGAVHQDHHGLWIAADGKRMIEANDGGASISLDGGNVWDQRYNVSIAQIYHIGYDRQNPYHVCGGMQDNDAYCGPSDSLSQLGILNRDWRDVGNDGDGSWVWPDPLDPQLVWNVGVRDLNGQLGVYSLTSRQNFDVTPYLHDTNGAPLAGLPYRFEWEAPIALSPRDPHVAYFGANVVFETSDRGLHWKQISPDLTRAEAAHQQVAGGPINTDVSGAEFYDTLLDIAPSALADGVIWTGSDDGLVHVTRDGGNHWRDVTPPHVGPYGRIDSIEASPHAASSAFVVVDRHVMGDPAPYAFATDDYGASWKALNGDLASDDFVRVIRQDVHNPDILYAGTEHGVRVSFDRGQHWRSLQLNLGTVSVHDMRVQPAANDLLIATHGRGFFILDDLSSIENGADAARGGFAFFQPRTAYNFYRWWSGEYGTQAGECCAASNFFAGENPPAGALLTFYQARAAKTKPTLTISDASGHEIVHTTAPNQAGWNRFSWDLAEDGAVPWLSAKGWNQGGADGPSVIPGAYRLTLRAGDMTQQRTLEVKPDPRATWTQAQYVERHDFLRSLYDELTQVDRALNALDDYRRALARQLQSDALSRGSSQTQTLKARLNEARALSAELSSNPRNSEDDQWRPDRLRERLQTLIDAFGLLSQGPPLEGHRREAAEIKQQFDALMQRYRTFARWSGRA